MKISTVSILIFVSIHLFLNVEGTNGSVIKNGSEEEKEDLKSSVVLVKPASMTDAQYTKFMKQIDGKDMTDEQKLQWWEKIQNWWSRLMERIGALGRKIAGWFERLFNPRRGTGSGFDQPSGEELERAPTPDEFLRGSGRGTNTGGSGNFNPPTDYNVLRGREPRVYGDGLVTVSPYDNEVYGRLKKGPTDKGGVIRESI